MQCFPVCAACTGLCKGPVQAASTRKPRRPWKPNDEIVRLKCGCQGIPFPLLHVLGEHIDKVLCPDHGWQPLAPERKSRKCKPEIKGQLAVPF